MSNVSKQLSQDGILVGTTYDKVSVEKELFGGSFKIKIGKDLYGFLHKTHSKDEKSTEEESEEEEPLPGKKKAKKVKTDKELTEGQKLEKVRVKEINYFDGCPILSMKEDIVNASALNYDNIKCGDFIATIIQDVNEQGKFITLEVNEFVKGRLYIEHMADYPLKVIPPKYRDVGKQLKVRVFNIDAA